MLSVRARKRVLWAGTGVAWFVTAVVVTLSLTDPEAFHLRTLTLVALAISSMLFSTSVIASLIQAPDVAYRIGTEHGRSGTCDNCRQVVRTGTDGVVLRFTRQHTDN